MLHRLNFGKQQASLESAVGQLAQAKVQVGLHAKVQSRLTKHLQLAGIPIACLRVPLRYMPPAKWAQLGPCSWG